MRITESQLRRIIAEEIVEMYEVGGSVQPATSGEKKAEKAIGASSITSYDTAAAGVNDAKGLEDLILSTIKSTALAKSKNVSAISSALNNVKKVISDEINKKTD
jgi:hypothetical protein